MYLSGDPCITHGHHQQQQHAPRCQALWICYFVECWQIPCKWDIILLSLQVGKLTFKEIKKLTQSLLSVAESKEKKPRCDHTALAMWHIECLCIKAWACLFTWNMDCWTLGKLKGFPGPLFHQSSLTRIKTKMTDFPFTSHCSMNRNSNQVVRIPDNCPGSNR